MGRVGGFGLIAAAILACSCGRSLPGSNLSYYLLDESFTFSDGTIAVVRRVDTAARVFVLGAESEAFAPIGELFTHVVGKVSVRSASFLVVRRERGVRRG